MQFSNRDTALVVIDPQNDVLSEKGISWGIVGESVQENNTVEDLARLFTAAKEGNFAVFISPHYLYPHDQAWQFGGVVEKMMLEGKEFFRPDPLGREGFAGSGADGLDRYKPFIEDGCRSPVLIGSTNARKSAIPSFSRSPCVLGIGLPLIGANSSTNRDHLQCVHPLKMPALRLRLAVRYN